ncbi:MAG: hypothetical protein SVW02_03840 [Candidatus Nanohaloarchaea archaeon]|nr:hypothetical protein [Candidatus Nanohaloarchaea archaeon]
MIREVMRGVHDPEQNERRMFENAVERYLEGDGDAVLDVGNPLGSPSLYQTDTARIGELGGDYVCVNPGNNNGDYGQLHMRSADGMSRSADRDGPTGINDIVSEMGFDDPLYMVVNGMTQIFTYYTQDFGHVDGTSSLDDRPERLRETADVYARNLSDMATDELLMVDGVADPELLVDPHSIESNDMPPALLDHFQDQLEERGWNMDAYDDGRRRVLAGDQD